MTSNVGLTFCVGDIVQRFTISIEQSNSGHFTHETESPWPLHSKHFHWCKTWALSKFASHYAWETTIVHECKMDVKYSYKGSYMATNGSCFMVTWTIFRNHLLEVSLTQNRETMALPTLITVGLFYLYHVWGPAWKEVHWNSIWLRARSHTTSHYTWGSVTTLHGLGGVWGRHLDTLPLSSHNFTVTAFGLCVK